MIDFFSVCPKCGNMNLSMDYVVKELHHFGLTTYQNVCYFVKCGTCGYESPKFTLKTTDATTSEEVFAT